MRQVTCSHGPTNDYVLTSPIGTILVKSCPSGLHSVGQTEDVTDDTFKPNESLQVRMLEQKYEDNGYTYKPVLSCVRWLNCYFHEPEMLKELEKPALCKSVRVSKDNFIGVVWSTLSDQVSFGETISYGALATLCSRHGAARAVGTALRRNPIQILIPCHRVVRWDGGTGHYSGGRRDTVKAWLLEHEKKGV
ncbi:methylated-DNA--protein-cysteine methyltransferase-like [Ornithodoros turicata]